MRSPRSPAASGDPPNKKTKPGGNSSRVAEQPPRGRVTDEVTPLPTIPASLVAQAFQLAHTVVDHAHNAPRFRSTASVRPKGPVKKQSATSSAKFSGRNQRSQCYGIRTRDLSAFTRSNCELRHPGKMKHAFLQRICLNRKRLDRNDLGRFILGSRGQAIDETLQPCLPSSHAKLFVSHHLLSALSEDPP